MNKSWSSEKYLFTSKLCSHYHEKPWGHVLIWTQITFFPVFAIFPLEKKKLQRELVTKFTICLLTLFLLLCIVSLHFSFFGVTMFSDNTWSSCQFCEGKRMSWNWNASMGQPTSDWSLRWMTGSILQLFKLELEASYRSSHCHQTEGTS